MIFNFPDDILRLVIIDIHTHTYPTSEDSALTPERLILESKRMGLDGICITDHDGFWTPEGIREISERYDFPVFPGCEVTTEEGHLLVYGLTQYIFGMHRSSFVRQLVDKAGGAIVVAHPYRRNFRPVEINDRESYNQMLDKTCESDVFGLSDAVEVLNGRGSEQENTFSQKVADRVNMKGTGASDAHHLEDIGTFATEFSRSISSIEDFISELKAGRFQPIIVE